MKSVLDDYAAILNSNWLLIRFAPCRQAIELCMRERAYALDTSTYQVLDWDEWINHAAGPDYAMVKTPTRQVPVPQIIVLAKYGGKPERKLSYSKPAVLHRDNHKCLFCGVQLPAPKLTIDHVIPRSRGGKTDFVNAATACEPCNRKKADKTPEEAGMAMRYQPYVPNWSPKLRIPKVPIKECWKPFLAKI